MRWPIPIAIATFILAIVALSKCPIEGSLLSDSKCDALVGGVHCPPDNISDCRKLSFAVHLHAVHHAHFPSHLGSIPTTGHVVNCNNCYETTPMPILVEHYGDPVNGVINPNHVTLTNAQYLRHTYVSCDSGNISATCGECMQNQFPGPAPNTPCVACLDNGVQPCGGNSLRYSSNPLPVCGGNSVILGPCNRTFMDASAVDCCDGPDQLCPYAQCPPASE